MRSIRLCTLLVLLCSPMASAAVVTYTLQLNDNGSEVATANNFAVYAEVSHDNGGLFAFGVDLMGATFGTFLNRAPGLSVYNPDTGDTTDLGFTVGRTQDAANGKVSGLQNLAASPFTPVYGFGQEDGSLND